MSDIINKKVILQEVEQTTTQTGKIRFKIKADGENFGLWKMKADGTETKAFQFLKTLGLEAVGQNVELSYTEEKGEYEGKQVTYRTIIGMKKTEGLLPRQEQVYQTSAKPFDRLTALEDRVTRLEGLNLYKPEEIPQSTTTQLAQELGGEVVGEIRVEDIPF
jgi:hypothetical protein